MAMANKIQFKRGEGAPAVGALDVGEPGFDLTNKKLYIGTGITETPILINEDPEVYADDAAMEVMRELLNADTLGGYPASDYATQTFVTNKIAEAQLAGGDIDLSGVVSKDELNTLAAPAGYGYGESLVGLGNANDDATFTAALSEQFAKTANKTRQFYFTYGGGAYLGKLWNAGNNYGVLVATSYAEPNVGYRFKQMVRVCTNGTWGAWVDNSPTAFAPAGYGLGVYSTENKITSKSALDDFKKNGWFVFLNESAPLVVCGFNCSYAYGRVDAYNGSRAKMTITPVIPEKATTFVRYLLSDGKWSAWKPADTTMELLWENATPLAAFAAQSIAIENLSQYRMILVDCLEHWNAGAWRWYHASAIAQVNCDAGYSGGGTPTRVMSFGEEGTDISYRPFTVYTDSIYFSSGYYATTFSGTPGTSNNILIPLRIYGIR